jgi:hypothetical protein
VMQKLLGLLPNGDVSTVARFNVMRGRFVLPRVVMLSFIICLNQLVIYLNECTLTI